MKIFKKKGKVIFKNLTFISNIEKEHILETTTSNKERGVLSIRGDNSVPFDFKSCFLSSVELSKEQRIILCEEIMDGKRDMTIVMKRDKRFEKEFIMRNKKR